jgi:hypothetical protein
MQVGDIIHTEAFKSLFDVPLLIVEIDGELINCTRPSGTFAPTLIAFEIIENPVNLPMDSI